MQEMGKKILGGMIFILKIPINCVRTIFSEPTTLTVSVHESNVEKQVDSLCSAKNQRK